ncbi:hypothetical protein ACOMHN_046217 [Nucella lapillus]
MKKTINSTILLSQNTMRKSDDTPRMDRTSRASIGTPTEEVPVITTEVSLTELTVNQFLMKCLVASITYHPAVHDVVWMVIFPAWKLQMVRCGRARNTPRDRIQPETCGSRHQFIQRGDLAESTRAQKSGHHQRQQNIHGQR